MKMNPFLAGVLFTLSILSLQLGFSYWSSGATLGCLFYLMLISIHRLNPLVHAKSLFPLWLFASILAFQISYFDNLILLKLRLIFFLLLFTIAYTSSLNANIPYAKIKWVSDIYDTIGILLPHVLLTFYILSLFPSSPLGAEKLVQFKDRWLIANKVWDTFDQALNALNYSSQVSRISLLYGEPSYLSMVVFIGLFIIFLSISIKPINKLNIKASSIFSRDFLLISSFLSGIILLLFSFSAYGYICLIVVLAITLYKTNILPSLGVRTLYIFGLVIILSLFFVTFDFFAPILTRFFSIISGVDDSAGGRIYALQFLPESLFRFFGLGDQLQTMLINSDYKSVDVGLAFFLLTYGFPFIFFLIFIYFRLQKIMPQLAGIYFLYLLLIWSQSGNILSTDKFFASVIPLPLILIYTKFARANP